MKDLYRLQRINNSQFYLHRIPKKNKKIRTVPTENCPDFFYLWSLPFVPKIFIIFTFMIK